MKIIAQSTEKFNDKDDLIYYNIMLIDAINDLDIKTLSKINKDFERIKILADNIKEILSKEVFHLRINNNPTETQKTG